jgi:hypothetical protein
MRSEADAPLYRLSATEAADSKSDPPPNLAIRRPRQRMANADIRRASADAVHCQSAAAIRHGPR